MQVFIMMFEVPLNKFNPAIFLCLSQTRTRISSDKKMSIIVRLLLVYITLKVFQILIFSKSKRFITCSLVMCLLAFLEYDISKCWRRLKTPLIYITILPVHSTYANILKNRYKKVRKNVGIG